MILTFNSYHESSYFPNVTEFILTFHVLNLQSTGPTETDVSMEDATDGKNQHQPGKRKRNNTGGEDRERVRDRRRKSKVVMLELSFPLSHRCTNFH